MVLAPGVATGLESGWEDGVVAFVGAFVAFEAVVVVAPAVVVPVVACPPAEVGVVVPFPHAISVMMSNMPVKVDTARRSRGNSRDVSVESKSLRCGMTHSFRGLCSLSLMSCY